MIIAISEGKDGTRYVEIHKVGHVFSIKLPQDVDGSFPVERLDQIKSALEDAIWAKGRYTVIPEKSS